MSKRHMGSSIDDFRKEEGIFEEAQAQAIKEVVAWQFAQAYALTSQDLTLGPLSLLADSFRAPPPRW